MPEAHTKSTTKADKPEQSSFWVAFLEMQKELPTLAKDAKNDYFKSGGKAHAYVPLEHVIEVVLPILHSHGFAVSQPVTYEDGQPCLTTILVYTPTAEERIFTMSLAIKDISPQNQGSAITYARRYQLMSALGIVGEDDDDATRAERAVKEKQKAADTVVTTQRTSEIYMMLATAGFDPDEYEKALGKKVAELTGAEADEVTAKLGAYINRERAKAAAAKRAETQPASVPEAV